MSAIFFLSSDPIFEFELVKREEGCETSVDRDKVCTMTSQTHEPRREVKERSTGMCEAFLNGRVRAQTRDQVC